MSRETTLAKLATMAQLLDDAGLYDDATILDEALATFGDSGIRKEAGMWKNILSRLSGWARKVLFKEYRDMYQAAKETQERIDARLKQLEQDNKKLKKQLSLHQLPTWHDSVTALLSGIAAPSVNEALATYDEQLAKMTARLLKLTPKKEPKKSIIPPLMPEDKEPSEKTEKPPDKEIKKAPDKEIEKALEPEAPSAPEPVLEEPIPLTKVKKPGIAVPPEPVSEPVPPEPISEPAPPKPTSEPAPEPTAAPAAPPPAGWRKERFGKSGKHGWDWEWEVSDDNNRMRLPKTTLALISSGRQKVIHGRSGKYYPTGLGLRAGRGATSSQKLRDLMGHTYWVAESDPSDPNMVILVRTDEDVPPPLSMRQEPTGQAEKLKELGKRSSAERMGYLMAVAAGELFDDEPSEEERLDRAAQALLESFEQEETEEEEV